MDTHAEAIALYLECVRQNGLTEKQAKKLPVRYIRMLHQGADGRYWLAAGLRGRFAVVMTGGVFDVIHHGHITTLRAAKELGDVLVVAIATDKTVKRVKGHKPMHSQNERAEIVSALRDVDLAVVGVSKWQDTLKRVGPDVVAFGYDQRPLPIEDEGIAVVQLEVKGKNPNSKTGKVRETLGL